MKSRKELKENAITLHNKSFSNDSESNLKYLSRCQYYGVLENWEYVNNGLVLVFKSYTATEYFGGTVKIRTYVPTDKEENVIHDIRVGERYFFITAPYKVRMAKGYPHRVDLLLHIFQEIGVF